MNLHDRYGSPDPESGVAAITPPGDGCQWDREELNLHECYLTRSLVWRVCHSATIPIVGGEGLEPSRLARTPVFETGAATNYAILP